MTYPHPTLDNQLQTRYTIIKLKNAKQANMSKRDSRGRYAKNQHVATEKIGLNVYAAYFSMVGTVVMFIAAYINAA
jgi:hypothetical protein